MCLQTSRNLKFAKLEVRKDNVNFVNLFRSSVVSRPTSGLRNEHTKILESGVKSTVSKDLSMDQKGCD